MSKFRIILIVIFFMIIPIKVMAADSIDYGTCINKFGSIKLVSTGKDDGNHVNKIDFANTENTKRWNEENVKFDLILTTDAFHKKYSKIKEVKYFVDTDDADSCEGIIRGDLLLRNEGIATFNFLIDKGYVDSIKITLVLAMPEDLNQTIEFSETIGIRHLSKDNSSDSDSNNNNNNNQDTASDDVLNPYQTPQEAMKGNCDESFRTGFLHKYWRWIMILTPILLIVMITIDFVKALSNNDSDAIKKSSTNAVKRVIAGVILLALPMLLDIIFGWFGLEICF